MQVHFGVLQVVGSKSVTRKLDTQFLHNRLSTELATAGLIPFPGRKVTHHHNPFLSQAPVLPPQIHCSHFPTAVSQKKWSCTTVHPAFPLLRFRIFIYTFAMSNNHLAHKLDPQQQPRPYNHIKIPTLETDTYTPLLSASGWHNSPRYKHLGCFCFTGCTSQEAAIPPPLFCNSNPDLMSEQWIS